MNVTGNWFDLLTLGLLVVGLLRGRKLGMSGELLLLLQWAAIVVIGAYAHKPLGAKLATVLPLGVSMCKVIAYLLIAAVIVSVTGILKRKMGEKLVSQDIFGKGEFYLGMMSGTVRYALMLIAALALLNSVNYSKAQLEASRKRMEADLGSDLFGWAHPARIQRMALEQSFVGPQLRAHVGHLLISPTRAAPTVASAETPKARQTRQMNEIIGGK